MASTPCWPRRSSPTTSAVSRPIARFTLVALATLAACKAPSTFKAPIFIAGRSVATMGDSLFAVPAANAPVVLVLNRDGRVADTLGAGTLTQPVQIQALADTWFVSDGGGTAPTLFAFTAGGHLLRETSLAAADPASAQFAPTVAWWWRGREASSSRCPGNPTRSSCRSRSDRARAWSSARTAECSTPRPANRWRSTTGSGTSAGASIGLGRTARTWVGWPWIPRDAFI